MADAAESTGDKQFATTGEDTTGGLSSGDVLPSFPDSTQVSTGNTPTIDDAVAVMASDCDAAYTAAASAINAHINECLNDCRMSTAGCTACILGAIERETGIQSQILGKCWDRVGKLLTSAVSESINTSAAAGVTAPTEDQLLAALTGQPIPDAISTTLGDIVPVDVSADVFEPVPLPPLPPGIELPEGAVRPVGNLTTGILQCPDPSPPYRDTRSPTGWLQDAWRPVYGQGGQLLWCVKETHSADAPRADGSGGNGSGQGSTDGTTGSGSQPGNGSSGGIIGQGTTPSCQPGDNLWLASDPTYQQYLSDHPGAIVLPTGQTDSSGNAYVCIHLGPEAPVGDSTGVTTESGSTESTVAPVNIQGGICTPSDLVEWAEKLDVFISSSEGKYGDLQQATGAAIGTVLTTAASKLLGIPSLGGLGSIVTGLAGATAGVAGSSVLRNLIKPLSGGEGCNSDAFFASSVAAGFARLFGGWFGTVPSQSLRSYEYAGNYICPNIIPPVEQMDAMFSRGYLPEKQWIDGVRFNGYCPEWQKKVIETSKNRIGIQDAFRLFKLGKLSGSEFIQSWQRQGVDTDSDLALWNEAIIQYPGVADIIRMMVRDIADPAVVTKLGLEDEFADKWQGQLKQWGESQGVTDNIAKAFWAAHWQTPSPGQVFDWLHRLRPDDRDPSDEFASLTVNRDVARQLLQIADYVPGLLDFYIATSYRPLTRVDVRRAYEVGAIKEIDAVRRSYRDLGYDAKNAQTLADFTEITSRPKRAALAGEVPAKEVQKAYQDELLSQDEAQSLLDQAGLTTEQVSTYIGAANTRRTVQARKLRLAALKKRFMMGEFDEQEAINQINLAATSREAAIRIAGLWAEERLARAKQPTVAVLCKWYTKGLIQLDEYFRRVRNLNYSEVDASRVVQQCLIGIQERQKIELEKENARIAKQEENRLRAAAAAERERRKLEREAKLRHLVSREQREKVTDKKRTVTVTDVVTDKIDDNVTAKETHIVEHVSEQPPP